LVACVVGKTWVDKRNVAMVSLMVRAGLRVGEVIRLGEADLYLAPRSGHVVIREGKGAKERTVPLGRQVRSDLEAYRDVRPSLESVCFFVSRAQNPLATRDVQRLVRQAGTQAGIDQIVTPHLLRHTFATRVLQQGKMDLATLSAILGHESLLTTARYLHPNRAQVAAMMEEL
jgi:site-specific recombinase XerD